MGNLITTSIKFEKWHLQLCILEYGSTFDHSDVVQRIYLPVGWKTIRQYLVSALACNTKTRPLFILIFLIFLTKKKQSPPSDEENVGKSASCVAKKDLLLLCSSDNAQSGEVGRNKQITAIEILTPDIGLSLWRQIAPQTNARSRDSFSSFAISPQSSEC